MEKGLRQVWLLLFLAFVKFAKDIYVGAYGAYGTYGEESSWASHGAGVNKGLQNFAVIRLNVHLLLGSQRGHGLTDPAETWMFCGSHA